MKLMIHGIGKSTYDGWYEEFVFGAYNFESIDSGGNDIYIANKHGQFDNLHNQFNMPKYFYKVMNGDWAVRFEFLY